MVVRVGCIIHVSRPLLQLNRPEVRHEIRSKKTSAPAPLLDLLHRRGDAGVKPKVILDIKPSEKVPKKGSNYCKGHHISIYAVHKV